MSEAYIEDFLQKVESGLQEAQQHMLEEKALHNSSVVVSDGNGCVLEIPAKKFLHNQSSKMKGAKTSHNTCAPFFQFQIQIKTTNSKKT